MIAQLAAVLGRIAGARPRAEAGRAALLAALTLVPLASAAGAAIDLGMKVYVRQKLDAAAESALAAALAQSRSLRASRWDVSVEEMEAKGRGRADLVFNAQKPSVRDITTAFTLTRVSVEAGYVARVSYAAQVNTQFLRFFGVKTLDLAGDAATQWIARDALIDDRFAEFEEEARARGAKSVASPVDWIVSGRAGPAPLRFADPSRYDGAAPPDVVRVAAELEAPGGRVTMSKKLSAEPGPHLLRYWYRDRSADFAGAPAWLCATREEDVDWMGRRERGAAGDAGRMSVYLVPDGKKGAPGDFSLGSSSRLDSCFGSGGRWIERVIRIDILTRGDYWLSFRREGAAEGPGPAIANILFCREPCADAASAPRPAADFYPWKPGELLFEDRFQTRGEQPLARSGEAPGWARPLPGWTAWPVNAVNYVAGENGASGYVSLDMPAEGGKFENRAMGRPFLFTPGFYQLRYVYSVGGQSLNRMLACNYFGVEAALQRLTRIRGADTQRIEVMIDPDAAYLHPEAGEGGAIEWRNSARLLERELTGYAPPRLPDLGNAVDFCAGAPPNASSLREINFRIDRAGLYWITFAGDGPADGEGGRISDVQIFARGSSYAGAAIPRIVRYAERGDLLTPQVGTWLIKPPGESGRALYRVQVQ